VRAASRSRVPRYHVIPVCLLIGMALGRWWRLVVPIAGLGWAVVLLLGGAGSGVTFVIGAATLAGLNAAADRHEANVRTEMYVGRGGFASKRGRTEGALLLDGY
jgi:hypothetical protein